MNTNLKTTTLAMSGNVNTFETVYACGTSDDKKTIVCATVKKISGHPTEIKTRRGDVICVGDDSLDALITALQMVRKHIEDGNLKRGI